MVADGVGQASAAWARRSIIFQASMQDIGQSVSRPVLRARGGRGGFLLAADARRFDVSMQRGVKQMKGY